MKPIDRNGLDEKYRQWIERIESTHGGVRYPAEAPPAFTPLPRPLAECTVALLTTAGAHLDDQPPFHTETVAGDASWRVIEDGVELDRLRFSHTHYDTTSAEKDPNVVFPLDRLHELVDRGRIGATAPVHIGMMGFNPDPTALVSTAAPAVRDLLIDAEADVVILVPG